MHKVTMNRGSARSNKILARIEHDRGVVADNIGEHMKFIIPFVLYEYFDFSWKKLDNCMTKMHVISEIWKADETKKTSEKMLNYCAKKKIDAYGFVKSIPNSQKMYLGEKGCVNAMNTIESALLHCLLMIIPILKETYKFSNAKIDLFFEKIAYIIACYSEKLPREPEHVFSDRYIRDIFLEEQNFDMFTGEYVA